MTTMLLTSAYSLGVASNVTSGPDPNDEHEIVYFQRHAEDDQAREIPAQSFLMWCPTKIRAKFAAVVVAVAKAPPHKFSGGGYWEAMHGEMKGWYEVRVDGQKPAGGKGRHHYRLFCLIDRDAVGAAKPYLVLIVGLDKPFRTVFQDSDYLRVRALGEEYLARNPRSIA